MEKRTLVILTVIILLVAYTCGIFVDTGNPYKDGPLQVGELTLQETQQGSPIHTKAYFPLQAGEYPVIFFVGGLNSLVLAEYYSGVLTDVASHGFFVFGADYIFPILEKSTSTEKERTPNYGQDIDLFFKELSWLEKYFTNRTVATPLFNNTGIMCHSSGCDVTLRMIKNNSKIFQSTIFLEPFSNDIKEKINLKMPAFMYGTQYSEEGLFKCAIPGLDYKKFYDIWLCPKVMMNVAGYGHCDILDYLPWLACHETHFCKTTNKTVLPGYQRFVQGAVSSFFISTLQHRTADMMYISQRKYIPVNLLNLESDFNCSSCQ